MMYFCIYGCGRFIGCFACCYRLKKCPLCRKNLPDVVSRKPLQVPGLATSLQEKELTSEELDEQIEIIKECVTADETDNSDLEELPHITE